MNFEVKNINCQNCVSLIKNSLSEYGEIEIKLRSGQNSLLSVSLSDENIAKFKQDLSELGFEIVREL